MYLVYLLREKQTGKVIYVGSSARPAARMKEHVHSLNGKKKLSEHFPLYDYMREHSLRFYKDVVVEWVDVAKDKPSMLALEEQYYYQYKDTVLNDRPAEDRTGEFNPKRRIVKCLTDGKEFETVSACAEYYGYARTTLSCILHGKRRNKLGRKFLFMGKEV